MFASHRPRVFRSRLGCCICGAKSSSSRFTSSSKYELLFRGCFQLNEERQGEICNACVLLVKRWKKLPSGSAKNWKHVVDSKATVKRTTKPRRSSRNSMIVENGNELTSTMNGSRATSGRSASCGGQETRDDDEIETDSGEMSPTLMCGSPSPSPSDVSDDLSSGSTTTSSKQVRQVSTASQTSFLFPSLTSSANNKLPFIDLSMWRREEICCGTIFRGPHGEVLVDPKLLNPVCTCSCSARPPVHVAETKSVN